MQWVPGVMCLLIGTVGGIFGATTTENVSLIGAGSFTAFALAGFALMFRTWAKENTRLTRRCEQLEVRAFISDWRYDTLTAHLRKQGVNVPRAVHDGPTKEELHAYFGNLVDD